MKILLVLFIFIYNSINIVQSESNFTKGFNAGYSQFFCRNVSNCNLKIPEVTKHDPELSTFQELHDKGLCDLRIVPEASLESSAKMALERANEILLEMTSGRARCFKVEARENDKNSAIFSLK